MINANTYYVVMLHVFLFHLFFEHLANIGRSNNANSKLTSLAFRYIFPIFDLVVSNQIWTLTFIYNQCNSSSMYYAYVTLVLGESINFVD